MRDANAKIWEAKTRAELKKLFPKIKLTNLMAKFLGRNFKFSVQMMREFNPNSQKISPKIKLMIRVNNNEDGYIYDWEIQKFDERFEHFKSLEAEKIDTGKT